MSHVNIDRKSGRVVETETIGHCQQPLQLNQWRLPRFIWPFSDRAWSPWLLKLMFSSTLNHPLHYATVKPLTNRPTPIINPCRSKLHKRHLSPTSPRPGNCCRVLSSLTLSSWLSAPLEDRSGVLVMVIKLPLLHDPSWFTALVAAVSEDLIGCCSREPVSWLPWLPSYPCDRSHLFLLPIK